ncbi:hypothetical protein [Altererythrobacter aquiaggeris]
MTTTDGGPKAGIAARNVGLRQLDGPIAPAGRADCGRTSGYEQA